MIKAFVEIDQATCADVQKSGKLEWWLANGLGGYASGTVSGILSRRYHGLLVTPPIPKSGRMLLFVKADATLLHDDTETPLYTNQWNQGEIVPEGYLQIEHFYLDGNMPVWQFRAGKNLIEQRVWMPHGHNQTCVAFRLVNFAAANQEPLRIRLDLIASYRDHHNVNAVNSFELSTQLTNDGLHLHYPQGEQLHLFSGHGQFKLDNTWIENFFLKEELQRGLESIDHHLRVGQLEIPLSGDWNGLVISTEKIKGFDLVQSMTQEYQRMADILEEAFPGLRFVSKPAWVFQLVAAADSFLFERQNEENGSNESIIAGYPWFGDWGRDTMIALPGLCLATGRYDVAWRILKTFSDFVDEGMLPNNFSGHGEKPEYNSVDASLWYIEAWRAYFQATGDLDAIDEALPLLEEIIYAYRDGTRYGIVMDPDDGLIMAGEAGQQLTWMDARVDGREITPRIGKPVEINALWYNALQSMVLFCKSLGQPSEDYEELAALVKNGFKRFTREDAQGLYDVLDGPDGHDDAIRPNQIFALSLEYSPLTSIDVMLSVLDICEEHLLTPYGLRSLAPSDADYAGRYQGGVASRDSSYHQGCVWGWLLGHFALAEYHVIDEPDAAQKRLDGMQQHLSQAGLGQISEIFDGDAPHEPKGAPAQAWSVACTLEAWWKLERAKLARSK